jgi:glucan biosynthesis protein C
MGGPAPSARYHAMDTLRGSMTLFIVLFHSAYFVTGHEADFPNDLNAYTNTERLVLFLHGFQLPLFFVAAGFFGAMLWHRLGAAGMIRNRLRRILLPLVVAWLVLVPLTRGAEFFASTVASSGSLAQGFVALGQGHWLLWDKIYHLWFLIAVLYLYAVALLFRFLVERVPKLRQDQLIAMTRRFFASPWRPVILALIITFAIVALRLVFNRAFKGDLTIAGVLVFFFMGWVLYSQADLLPRQRQYAWTYLIAGALVLVPAFWINRTFLLALADTAPRDMVALLVLATISANMVTALWTFGLLGLFVSYYEEPSRILRYLSDASYWIYLVHMPLVIFVAGLLIATALPEEIRLVLIVSIVIPILLLSYHLCVRFTAIGAALNGRKLPRRSDMEAMPA